MLCRWTLEMFVLSAFVGKKAVPEYANPVMAGANATLSPRERSGRTVFSQY